MYPLQLGVHLLCGVELLEHLQLACCFRTPRKELVKLRLSSHCCRFPSFLVSGILLCPRHKKASNEPPVLCRLWCPCQTPGGFRGCWGWHWWLTWHSVLRATYLPLMEHSKGCVCVKKSHLYSFLPHIPGAQTQYLCCWCEEVQVPVLCLQSRSRAEQLGLSWKAEIICGTGCRNANSFVCMVY